MSVLGQKQKFAPQKVMSALPPKADMCGATRDVRFGPKADSCSAAKRSLFDHLVGAGENRRWNCQAERLGRFKIDHQLVFIRRLHWQISWLLTLEDAVDVSGRPADGEVITYSQLR